MKIDCFAKVNLYLNISNKRQDGFHQIQSLFQTISLCEQLIIEPSRNFSIELLPESASFADANLLLKDNILDKVYRYFKSHYGVNGINIRLNKQIPIGAGLGGGSSDAAGLIVALNKLNNLALSICEMEKIASIFGSDVPFFIKGGSAIVTGKGEVIENFMDFEAKKAKKPPILYLVLIFPDQPINTKEAYALNVELNDNVNFEAIVQQFVNFPAAGDEIAIKTYVDKIANLAYNGFQSKTLNKYPAIYKAFKDLRKYSNYVLLSGSGSSVFAIFHTETDSQIAIDGLRSQYKYIYKQHTTSKGSSLC